MKAEWFISPENKLCLSISYRKPNETSDGTSGCSANWGVRVVTTIADAAEVILTNVKSEWNWREIENLDGWRNLL